MTLPIAIAICLILLFFLITTTIAYFRQQSDLNKEKKRTQYLDERMGEYNKRTDNLLLERNNLQDTITELKTKMELQEEEYKNTIVPAAIAKSRSVNAGLAIEQLAPLLSEYNPKDLSFLGQPFDYLVLDGLEDMRNGKIKELRKIVFLEIKSGASGLNAIQRKIKNKLPELEFKVMRIKENELVFKQEAVKLDRNG